MNYEQLVKFINQSCQSDDDATPVIEHFDDCIANAREDYWKDFVDSACELFNELCFIEESCNTFRLELLDYIEGIRNANK
jgi:hypothetical protein